MQNKINSKLDKIKKQFPIGTQVKYVKEGKEVKNFKKKGLVSSWTDDTFFIDSYKVYCIVVYVIYIYHVVQIPLLANQSIGIRLRSKTKLKKGIFYPGELKILHTVKSST